MQSKNDWEAFETTTTSSAECISDYFNEDISII